MATSLCLLSLLALSSSALGGLGLHRRQLLSPRASAGTSVPTAQWVTQRLDHFDNTNTQVGSYSCLERASSSMGRRYTAAFHLIARINCIVSMAVLWD